jgi:hypothetical protein
MHVTFAFIDVCTCALLLLCTLSYEFIINIYIISVPLVATFYSIFRCLRAELSPSTGLPSFDKCELSIFLSV